MADNLLLGTKYYISSNYEKAIEEFSKLINTESPKDQILGFLYKGTCLIELEQYEEAIKCLTKGLELNKKSFELLYKLGLALFKKNSYEEADQAFRLALINSNNSEEREKLVLWQNKSKIELDKIAEQKAKKIGNIKFSNNWFQTDEYIILTLDSNVVLNSTLISTKIEKRCVSVLYENMQIYQLMLSNAINENNSVSKILTQKIEFKLAKDVKGYNWVTIDEHTKNTVHNYPTSLKKDFNEINKKLAEELRKEDPDPKGNDAMINLFRALYDNADENSKRAMAKSYSTSGGTVFSTNWGEVKEKDYTGKDRPEAPKGQEWVDEKK